MNYTLFPHRSILCISGNDRSAFLQGLVSNDVHHAADGKAIYTCLLTPQGKFLHDFFIIPTGDAFFLTPETARAEELQRLLKKHRLRSKVTIEAAVDLQLYALWGEAQILPMVFPHPQHFALGSIALAANDEEWQEVRETPFIEYDYERILLGIPDGSRDMQPEQALLLENNVDDCHGIDWQKGCYMGQELTARTKYRGLLKKQLVPLRLCEGEMPPPHTPLFLGAQAVGVLKSSAKDAALGLIRREFLGDNVKFTAENAVFMLR